MSVCTSISKVREDSNGDLLEVIIDNTVHAYWFYPQADAMAFVGQEVIVEYRKDILDGNITQFIKTFTIPTVVNTLDKKDNIKLYLDQTDNQSNISFNEIKSGDTRPGCIVYCVAQEYKTSAHAVWMELTIRDRLMRIAKLRIFDYEYETAELAGKYIIGSFSRNKYGFQSDSVTAAPGEIRENPELAVAIQFIENYFSGDAVALNYIQKLNLINALRDRLDYEMGYGLVRLAMELAMCDALNNITNDVDVTAIGHAILTSFGYAARPNSILSPCVNNVFLVQQFPFPNKEVVVTCLDECLTEHSEEYQIIKNIKDNVSTILEIRKGFAS